MATDPAFSLYFYNYDPNGNMTLRAEVSGTQRITYTQAFDIESRLTAVTNTVNGATTTFTYDGDGALVKKTVGITTTYYVGPHYEKLVSTNVVTATKYYYFGSQRVAMRVCTGANGSCGTNGATSTLTYLHGDHLGSASLSTNATGGKTAEMRYYPYGETRSGSMTTDRQYTGQRREIGLGLYDYNARYYDPALGRFIQADTIVPSPANPQSLNRYSYVLNSPLRYTDPTGHAHWVGEDGNFDVAALHYAPPIDAGLTPEQRQYIYEHAYEYTASPLQKAVDVVITAGMFVGILAVPEFLAYAPAGYVEGAVTAAGGNLVGKMLTRDEVDPLELLVSFYIGGWTPESIASAGVEEALGWSIVNTTLQDTANTLLEEQRLPKWYELIGDTFSGSGSGLLGEVLNKLLNTVVVDEFTRSFVVGLGTDTIMALPDKEK